MTDTSQNVPVWALATQEIVVPDILGQDVMTPGRLGELRTALAALAAAPIATLEAHPVSARLDRTGGLPLHGASPLAQQLSQLVAQTSKSASGAVEVGATGEVLYRMVVPAKFAAEFGKGLVKPMVAKGVAGGIRSALTDSSGIVAGAAFVPVGGKAAVSGVAAAGAATAGAVTVGAALTVAAPLVLMAVAVGITIYVEQERQKAIEHITELLEKLHEDKLDEERNELDGCRDPVDKATSILLDKGRIGMSLGLDSAVHAISIAIERTRRRLNKWQQAIAAVPDGPIEVSVLTKTFPGINKEGGEFRAHLELAQLAIALKRRVMILQAVEHAQLEGADHLFETFVRTLHDDECRLNELTSGITSLLLQLSTLELKRPGGFRSPMFTGGEVDELLQVSYRLRAFGDDVSLSGSESDVAIDIERHRDGSLVVFPARAV
ncbi:hypothetical protein NVV95_03025 [Herbiconiux sp. CPCC 205716]|uniref:Uncharacterized protein n=1 Tax=Herbiconiux gentiana TaxID=2970912 RepID=A0ABT2GBE7_9MICO|nr:hypothetical protein [Herbiconiux gentiana]MCS5713523.1 hypothetical protein [Herbiconiux gentiana]